MGVYDSFWIDDLVCPKCHNKTRTEIQVKELFNFFNNFRLNDIVEDDTLMAKDGAYAGNIYCNECHILSWGYVIIKNSKFVRISNFKVEEPYDRCNYLPKETK